MARSWRARWRPRSPRPLAATSRRFWARPRRHVMPESCEATVTLTGDLHARPAGALAMAAAKFESAVELTAGTGRADGKSVLAIMGLGAGGGPGVTAPGPAAREAVAALIDILTEATRVGS